MLTHVPPQSVSEPLQTHAPATQVVAAGHTVPQVPQLEGSVNRSMHGPLGGAHWMVTSVPFGAQLHAPDVHCPPDGHLCPQVPQLLMSPERLTHVRVLLTWHMLFVPAHVQTPPSGPGRHVIPAVQTWPHPLQLFGS